MKAVTDKVQQGRSEDGFTLVETLIALLILAGSAGLLVQSVGLATSQIRTSALAETAELLAVSLLAERAASGIDDAGAAGTDQASGLHWRLSQERSLRVIDEVMRATASIVSIEVRGKKGSELLFELRSVSMEAQNQ